MLVQRFSPEFKSLFLFCRLSQLVQAYSVATKSVILSALTLLVQACSIDTKSVMNIIENWS